MVYLQGVGEEYGKAEHGQGGLGQHRVLGVSRRRSEDVKRGTSVMVMSVMEAVTMVVRTTVAAVAADQGHVEGDGGRSVPAVLEVAEEAHADVEAGAGGTVMWRGGR